MDQRFPKSERLRSRKEIGQLFTSGSDFLEHPFRVLWEIRETEPEIPLKCTFSVPKRKFKKASDRNLLKRRSREAFRKNRQELKDLLLKKDIALNVMLIYVAGNKLEYQMIQEKIILILQRLAKING